MSTNERIRRPKLERSEPIRNWSTLFEAPPASGEQPSAGGGTPRAERGARDLQDVVTRSVEIGYRVVDEYIRQGQQTAQRINDRSYGWASVASDLPDLAARFGQHASDLVAVWLEMMQTTAAGSAQRTPEGTGAPPTPGPDPSTPSSGGRAAEPTRDSRQPDQGPQPMRAPERTRVEIALDSQQPAEVSLDLRTEVAGRTLLVQALRSVSPDKPRLRGVTLEDGAGTDGVPRLSIAIPPHTPEGIYNALIIDEETNAPVGTVSVRIPATARDVS